jgi:hypothetical protein
MLGRIGLSVILATFISGCGSLKTFRGSAPLDASGDSEVAESEVTYDSGAKASAAIPDFEALAEAPSRSLHDAFYGLSIVAPDAVAWVQGQEEGDGRIVRLDLQTRSKRVIRGAVPPPARLFELNHHLVVSSRSLSFEDHGDWDPTPHSGRSSAALSPSGWLLSTGEWGYATSLHRDAHCGATVTIDPDTSKSGAFALGAHVYFIVELGDGPLVYRVDESGLACDGEVTAKSVRSWADRGAGSVVSDDAGGYLVAGRPVGGSVAYTVYAINPISLVTTPLATLRTAPDNSAQPSLAIDASRVYVAWDDGRIEGIDRRSGAVATMHDAGDSVWSLAADGRSVIYSTRTGVYRKRIAP